MPDKQREEAESEVGWAQVATERARTIRDLKAEVERLMGRLKCARCGSDSSRLDASHHCSTCYAEVRATVTRLETEVERALADLHKLIHEQSGLDDHRYSPEQMVTEMAQRWQGASDDCEKAERERDEARAALAKMTEDRDELRELRILDADNCPHCGERERLRSRIAKLEAVVDAARRWAERDSAYHGHAGLKHAVVNALRALDEQDSGGSGAVAAGRSDAIPKFSEAPDPPEPAGSSQDPLAALEAAVARPLTDEDRERIRAAVQPERPRGGLAPEPWERGPRAAYVTRAEVAEMIAEALRGYRRCGE